MTCLFYISCEKTGYLNQKEITDNQRISNRTVEDCEDCPLDYCCCSIELWGTTTIAPLNLCGFSNGASMCGTYNPPGNNCANFSGVGENILLESPDDRGVIVCKEENGVFRIANTSNNPVTLRMTCQADQTVPTFVIINIPGTSVVFYSTDDDCLLTECD